MKKARPTTWFLAALTLVAVLASACAPAATPTAAPTQPPQPTSTPVPPTAPPAPTATPVPLGSPERPIVMALAPSATTQELLASGEAIAKQISDNTGLTIQTTVPTSYGALVEAMGAGNAQIGWLPPFAYVVAHQKGYADAALSTIRFGSDHYGAQFIANAAAGFTAYFDTTTGRNTADAATALAQFADKKPCWTDPLSSSGYVIPLGMLNNLAIKTRAGAWVQGHSTVVRSVYLSPKGEICNFGATFIDARSGVARDFPDVNEKVVVIFATDPVIPNDNVSYAADLPQELRDQITDALLKIAETEQGKKALNDVYEIDGLKRIDDSFYDDFRVYLESSGVDVTSLVR